MTQICADPTSPMGQDPKAKASDGGYSPSLPHPIKDNTMATRFIDFLFRCLFGSPDQDYRGVPSVKDDQLFDKTMTAIAIVAAVSVVVLEVLK